MTQVRVAELGMKADLDADMASITLGCDVRGRSSFHGSAHLVPTEVGAFSMGLDSSQPPDRFLFDSQWFFKHRGLATGKTNISFPYLANLPLIAGFHPPRPSRRKRRSRWSPHLLRPEKHDQPLWTVSNPPRDLVRYMCDRLGHRVAVVT